MPKSKIQKDPAAPKRNLSAYLLYQNAMRETFKQQNPGMSFGQLSKYTSAMFAELSPEEKEAWKAQAEADKARYLQEMAEYVPSPGYNERGEAIIQYPRKKGKMERDPNAPKRAKSAYLLYQNGMRDQFRRENPGMTFGQLSKYTSAMYKCLTPEEKATWDHRAAQDKIRYEQEMQMYIPPPGHDSRGNVIEDLRIRTKGKKKVKDPNAPKRARGSFVFFTAEERPKLKAEMPDVKFIEMGTILGQRWRDLPPEERTKYEELSAEDKARFSREMAAYNASKAAADSEEQMHHSTYFADLQHMNADGTYGSGQHAAYDPAYQFR